MGNETELAIVFADVVGSMKLYEKLGLTRLLLAWPVAMLLTAAWFAIAGRRHAPSRDPSL